MTPGKGGGILLFRGWSGSWEVGSILTCGILYLANLFVLLMCLFVIIGYVRISFVRLRIKQFLGVRSLNNGTGTEAWYLEIHESNQ
jgi:hypothetical protein